MTRAHFLLFCCGAAACYADPPNAIAIRDARIVTVSGAVLPRGTVVMRNGLIEAVGENIPIAPDVWTLEGNGLTVYPGLIDALSSIGLPESSAGGGAARPGEPAAPNAATTAPQTRPRGPEDRPSNSSFLKAADQIQPTDRRIAPFRNGGFTTAVSFPTRGIFAGQGVVLNLAGEKPGQMIVSPSAGQYLTLGASSFRAFPGSLMGSIAYIRQMFWDKQRYQAEQRAYAQSAAGRRRPEYDKTLEGLVESPRILLPATRAVELDRMLRFAQELQAPAVLYGGHEAFRAVPLLQKANTPLLVSLKWPEAPREADPESKDPLHVLELRDQAPRTPALLSQAKVRYAFYTDGLATPAEVKRAVRKAITAGLPHDEAVRAMTLQAAEIYGVADRLGSIEPGKIANLVVTRGDLFAESSKVQHVFIDGTKYDPAPEAPAAAKPTPTARGNQP